MESLLNKSRSSSTTRLPIKVQRYFNNALDNKSICAIVSTSIYLCCHKTRQYNKIQNKYKTICYIIIILLILTYTVLSFYIDVPYWMYHGYVYHLNHFKWSSSLNGDFCDINNNTNTLLNKMSNNNKNFKLTRSRVLLLSFPRSGNHLTKAMIECLLQEPTYGYPKEKHDDKQQIIALKNANVNNPYIRKIHKPDSIRKEFMQYNQWGLIYLIRDPIECILSENKYVPYFWKDYEYQFRHSFMLLPQFYNKWNDNESKIIIYYEDYFNNTHGINLKKLANFFGKDRVSNERLNYCIDNYHQITQNGLNALDRGATSNTNLHFYRDKYFGSNKLFMQVTPNLYQNVFKRYENIQSGC